MTNVYNIYDQIAGILAQVRPEQVMAMQVSPETQQRFNELVEKSKAEIISHKEKDELDHFIVLERLFRLAKIRADKG